MLLLMDNNPQPVMANKGLTEKNPYMIKIEKKPGAVPVGPTDATARSARIVAPLSTYRLSLTPGLKPEQASLPTSPGYVARIASCDSLAFRASLPVPDRRLMTSPSLAGSHLAASRHSLLVKRPTAEGGAALCPLHFSQGGITFRGSYVRFPH